MFYRQFLMAASPMAVPPGWIKRAFGSMTLHTAPDLPVVEIECEGGSGFLLGWPIYQGRLFADGESLVYNETPASPLFRELSGRFVLLIADEQSAYCCLDPSGYLPVVYSPQQQILASTLGLIPRTDTTCDDEELIRALDIPAKDNWYPFDVTPRRNIHKLLPNYRLDLMRFQVARFWPDTDHPNTVNQVQIPEKVGLIASLLQRNIGAVAAHGDTLSQLTAGRDSRMMLAAARSHAHAMTFLTFGLPDWAAEDDCRIAERITTRLGLRHRVLPYTTPLTADMDDWLRDTGGCVGGRTFQLATMWKTVCSPTQYSLTGLGGELGRAVDWQDADADQVAISMTELLLRLSFRVSPVPDAILAAGKRWRDSLEPIGTSLLLDLGMIEVWVPCYASPSFYGHCHADISISPFNDRKIIETMLSLPVAYRASQMLVTDLIDATWPELNSFPFNPAAERLRKQWLENSTTAHGHREPIG